MAQLTREPGTIWIDYLPLSQLVRAPRNPKAHDVGAIHESLRVFGYVSPVILNETTGRLVAGHGRLDTLQHDKASGSPPPERIRVQAGEWLVPVIRGIAFKTDAEAEAYLLADNRIQWLGGWNEGELAKVVSDLAAADRLAGTGFDRDDVDDLLRDAGLPPAGAAPEGQASTARPGTLAARFLVAPFSVLNAREGWWQDRKRSWISLGIQSEIGRGSNLIGRSFYEMVAHAWGGGTGASYGEVRAWVDGHLAAGKTKEQIAQMVGATKGGKVRASAFSQNSINTLYADGEAPYLSGTSVFDPVLCELAYRWFCPRDGRVLDPFAGGSVRGIVAALLGRHYVGIDLREEQVQANRKQWAAIAKNPPLIGLPAAVPDAWIGKTTPVEQAGQVWVKRDDVLTIAGVQGGKVRTCWWLATAGDEPPKGLVTAGSRQSPQCNIVAHVAARLGVPCRLHVPQGELSPELEAARACGAEIVQHPAGYNNVIIARAREDAAARGWREIPFGMECPEAVAATAAQLLETLPLLPKGVKRIVVPVGSGMSLAGILTGLVKAGASLPVLGVQVGANPAARLQKWAPAAWRQMVQLVESPIDYHAAAPQTQLGTVMLDPIYEAKCLPFLQPGDLLWCVGIRQTAIPAAKEPPPDPRWAVGDSRNLLALAPGEFDFVFSCPPYFDLERYSDDGADLSNLKTYEAFLAQFADIIRQATSRLRPDRFACVVVGEIRDKAGAYRGFVGDTIAAFQAAGLAFYNEAILVTSVGTLPVRAGRTFDASRKLGKTHQNVLVFVKGDAKKATAACGAVEVQDIEAALAQFPADEGELDAETSEAP